MADRHELHIESWVIAAGRDRTPGSPLNVAPVLASSAVRGGEWTYARDEGTPTWAALEEIVGGLEGGHAVAFSSGMAAVAAVFDGLAVGATVVLPDDCYQGVAALASDGERAGRWSVIALDVRETRAWVEVAADVDLIWVESPSNPLLRVADLPAIGAATRRPGAILAVDNTFATPINQRPLELGADIVVHAATKFIGGHSDLLSGIAVAADEGLAGRLRRHRTLSGATPGALETYLASRGARTLPLRLERAQATALELAGRLVDSPSVDVVRYPGLTADPSHDVCARTLDGFGAIVTFDLATDAAGTERFCDQLRLITHATSLGGVESTIERRAAIAGQEHLPESLVRLSVGCEHVDDLWRDLEQAIASLGSGRPDQGPSAYAQT
ncbi:MAG: PLP-dependent transferase [Acidimicrobiia bacterium]|nr:PLP-dependent transferase [Acidimicrobiia bacterium]